MRPYFKRTLSFSMRILAFTGSEKHNDNGAKAQAFIRDATGTELYLHKSIEVITLSQDFQPVNDGKFGTWCLATHEIKEKSLLKLFAVSTYKDNIEDGGGCYCLVESTSPLIRISMKNADYSGTGGWIQGNLLILTSTEIKTRGIIIDPNFSQYYDPSNLIITNI